MEDCTVRIGNRTFWPNDIPLMDKIFSLPDLNITLPNGTRRENFQISNINQRNIQHLKTLADNLRNYTKIQETRERLRQVPTEENQEQIEIPSIFHLKDGGIM
ncbi:hypothetical protein Trydic_g8393 [Trypoxylus dichotomus]